MAKVFEIGYENFHVCFVHVGAECLIDIEKYLVPERRPRRHIVNDLASNQIDVAYKTHVPQAPKVK